MKLFKDWGWIIGTGIYIDDIEEKVAVRKKALEREVQAATASMQSEIESIKAEIQRNAGRVI